jgi:hypothetical protein
MSKQYMTMLAILLLDWRRPRAAGFATGARASQAACAATRDQRRNWLEWLLMSYWRRRPNGEQ